MTLRHVKILGNVLYTAVTVIVLSIAALLVFSGTLIRLPRNTRLFSVQSGSMQPTITTGSLVATQSQEEYAVGDVVTFQNRQDRSVVTTHRVVDKKSRDAFRMYTTKGDANTAVDQEEITDDLVLGKVVLSVPFIGYVLGFAKSQIGFLLLIILPSAVIIGSEVSSIKSEVVKYFQKKSENSENVLPTVATKKKKKKVVKENTVKESEEVHE